MKYLRFFHGGFVYLVLAAGTQALADDGSEKSEMATEFAALAAADNNDGQAWFQLAQNARDAGDTDTAASALAKAEELQYSPRRVSVERARIEVVRSNPDAATAILRQMFENGFPAVNIFTTDPVLGTLAGQPAFDALVTEMTHPRRPHAHSADLAGGQRLLRYRYQPGAGNSAQTTKQP